MRAALLVFVSPLLVLPLFGQPGEVLQVDFSNPGLTPPHWTMVIHPDGSGHFHSDRGGAPAAKLQTIEPVIVDRDFQLSEPFVDGLFATVHSHRLLNIRCQSREKVAFQGWKKISYKGPDGEGSCEFNYSSDKQIRALGDSLVSVASTMIEGARLELLLRHDPLGLYKEMEYVAEASEDGRLQQLGAIRSILKQLEDDPSVMEHVRQRARTLLAQACK
jgi:hypothetical protein